MDSGQPSAPAPRPALLRPAPLGPAPPQTRSVRRRSLDFSHPAAECDEPGPGGGLLRKPKAPCGGSERGFGCAPGTMRRSIRRAPSRKRKLEGRAKGGRESAAVNSFYLAALLHSVWTFLKLREMVRSGSRPGQVIPSGKHTGPAKLTNGKKGTNLRKIPRFNADSGYPTHSDSESQTETVQGLDGCASLLRDILRNEDSGSEITYSENRCNLRPVETKRYRSKKKGHEKHTVPSVVRKEILSSDKKKQIPNDASVGSERDSSDILQNWSLQDHCGMYSPLIYQALCEHVQTQMSLMNNLASKNNPNGIPTAPCHTVSGSESQTSSPSSYGLPTSIPVRVPRQPPCPPMVHSEVQTDGDSQFASQGRTTSVNCTDDVVRNSFNTCLGVSCNLPQTGKPATPTFQQLGLANGVLPKRLSEEPDLLKCFQTYMKLLRSHPDSPTRRSPTLLQPAFLATHEEKCTNEHIGEVRSEGKDLNIPLGDSRIKDVQKAKNVNQSAEKVRTIKYLLGELKALVAEQEDSEIQRVITELEMCISLLPAISANTNIQVEIALAMQPLRSENAHLRRQLRILNQQLREREKTQKASGSLECNLELFSLQSLNKSLQNQLQESLKSQELLQSKNEELLKVIENQKDENKKFAGIFKEKDQTLLENKQQFDIETTRMKIELEEALVNMKSSRFKLEAAEKENQILGITLRQRDAEVTRLRELTSTPGLPVHHQLPEFTQTHVHRVDDAIQPSHLLWTPSPPAPNPSQHQIFFSNESTLRMRWPKYRSFSFSIIPSKEIPGLISFIMDWLDLLAVQGTLKSLLQHHSSKASILWCSAFFTGQLSHPYVITGKTIALTRRTLVGKVMSLLFNMLSRLVITFLPRSKRLLISWLQSPSAVILEPPKIKSDTVSIVSPSISHEVMGPDVMIFVF
ncbi:coiled-coil domain-containing protein 14 isoform X3 [Bubalus kerabau]|uniref:coiled-coil domain-containing protein 14 isoform X3 n=2 Tax=Bubalus carabanensis TaxID=3119969 RepID=UPI00244E858C|nr:coiled-coil domain-containing protein 14 isoform X3 [Bubalus carabanensis]